MRSDDSHLLPQIAEQEETEADYTFVCFLYSFNGLVTSCSLVFMQESDQGIELFGRLV